MVPFLLWVLGNSNPYSPVEKKKEGGCHFRLSGVYFMTKNSSKCIIILSLFTKDQLQSV